MTVGLHLTNQSQPIARNLKKQPAVTLRFSGTLQKNRKLFTSVCYTTGNRTSMPGKKWLFKKLCVLPILYPLLKSQRPMAIWTSQVALVVKNPPANAGRLKRHKFDPGVGKIPWRKEWQPTPVFLHGGSHGQRSLAVCSPWGHTESDTTEMT